MSAAQQADPEFDSGSTRSPSTDTAKTSNVTGFEAAFDEDANFPCSGAIVGEQIEILHVGQSDGRRELIATCQRAGRQNDIALLDIDIHADPLPHGCSPHTAAGYASEANRPRRLRRRPKGGR
jgi:hypothetical protein